MHARRPGVIGRSTSMWGSRDCWKNVSDRKIQTSRWSVKHVNFASDEGTWGKCDSKFDLTEKGYLFFLFFIFFILTWIGGEKASQHVGHVTLSLRQGEGNHVLPHFPSQIQYFLFLLVLFVCWENFKVYNFLHHNGWIGGTGGKKKAQLSISL